MSTDVLPMESYPLGAEFHRLSFSLFKSQFVEKVYYYVYCAPQKFDAL